MRSRCSCCSLTNKAYNLFSMARLLGLGILGDSSFNFISRLKNVGQGPTLTGDNKNGEYILTAGLINRQVVEIAMKKMDWMMNRISIARIFSIQELIFKQPGMHT